MLHKTATLLQQGVEEKRKGNFSKAIMLYNQAIEIEPDKTPILYISLAKSQYLAGDILDCVDNYMRALYYQIIEIAHMIDVDRLSNAHYQISILHKFTNTLIHLAHAYIKEYDCIFDFYQLLQERHYDISYDDLYTIMDYLSENYAYDLASGGIDYPPDTPEIFLNYQDVDWNELFFIKGLQIAHTTINWSNISMLVIMNKGLQS